MYLKSFLGLIAAACGWSCVAYGGVVNSAPVLDGSKSPAFIAILEDAGAPVGAVGTPVSNLVDFAAPAGGLDNVSDADASALTGIAITAANTALGSWFYSINGGTSWSALPAVSGTSSFLLGADTGMRLYFQPTANYNGTISAAITFRAWDQTGGANASLQNTSGNGGSTPYSTATDTASLTVTPVNDPPSIQTLSGYSFYQEDQMLPLGQIYSVADADGDPLIVYLSLTDASAGSLFSWGGPGAFATYDDQLGILTIQGSTVAGVNQALQSVTFTPVGNFNGTVVLSASASDPYSSSPKYTRFLFGDAVPDAPILDNTKSPMLISEPITAGPPAGFVGTPVSLLVDFPGGGGLDNVSDGDAGADLGIAITGYDTSKGTWYYSTNNGVTWTTFPVVNGSQSLLLPASALVYLQPSSAGTHTNALTFRAWDQTSGTSGGTANTTFNNGGTTAFSAALDTASITVFAPNSAPLLNSAATPVLGSIPEDAVAPSGAVGTPVSSLLDFTSPAGGLDNAYDADAGALLGIALVGADTLNGTWYYSLNDGTSWSSAPAVNATFALLLPASSGRLYFRPAPDFNGLVSTAVTFRAWDQTSGTAGGIADTTANGGVTAFSSATDTANLSVTAVNDPPVITGQTPAVTTINTPYTIAFTNLAVTDVDNTYPTGFTLTASNGANYTRSGNIITPATNYFGGLSVPVKVNDGAADSALTNFAIVVVPPGGAITNIITGTNGTIRVNGLGGPTNLYNIQFSTVISSTNWQTLGTRTADAQATYFIIDTPPGVTSRFYRTIGP